MAAAKNEVKTTKSFLSSDFQYFHCVDRKIMDIAQHDPDFNEIYMFLSGDITYQLEGRIYKLKPGDILLIRGNDMHKVSVKNGKPYERIMLMVKPKYLLNNSSEKSNLGMCFESSKIIGSNLIRSNPKQLKEMRDILRKFEESCNSSSYGSNIIRDISVVDFILHVNRAFIEAKSGADSKDIVFRDIISNIVDYINDNLEAPLGLETISKKFFISKYHLAREFKKYTGFTLHKFVLQKRLILAKSLLNENTNINYICGMCGFNDYSNFIRAFKSAFGLPPKKYIESTRQSSGSVSK
ncbi:MAG: AraC family transcriptional regulator [Eubacteriales bacterium]|nr:AraC family transcriptional regulator [Eubacteriales bacterium]